MRFSSTKLGRLLDEVVARKTPRKIFPASIKGGRRAAVLVIGKRGRYVRYRIPVHGVVSDIAIMPTIRSAIMHSVKGKIEIKKTDLREKVRRRKVSILMTLVIDGSSSMVEGAKLSALRAILDDIFMDAYQKRDRIAVVHCGDGAASVLLSFAGNLETGRQALEKAPWGGTDSLAKGLALAAEVIAQRLRIEKNAIPIAVVLSDGEIPRSSEDEFTEALEKLAEKAGVLCVDVGAQTEETPMADLSGEMNLGYMRLEGAEAPKDLPGIDEVSSALTAMVLMLVNPRTGPALLTGYDPEAIVIAGSLVQERLWDIGLVKGCPAGCQPPDLAGSEDLELCPFCQTNLAAGPLKTTTVQAPVVHSNIVDAPGIFGQLFLKGIVRPGTLSATRKGLLLLSAPDIKALPEATLTEAFLHGSYSPVGAASGYKLPAGRKAAICVPAYARTKDRDMLGSIADLNRRWTADPKLAAVNLGLRRDAYLGHGLFLKELKVRLAMVLDAIGPATSMLKQVRADKEILETLLKVCDLFAPWDMGFAVKAMEVSRSYAALSRRDRVTVDDVRSALTFLLEGKAAPEILRPVLNEILLEDLGPLLQGVFHEPMGLVLEDPPEGFMDALKSRLDSLAPSIEVLADCQANCSFNEQGGLCPECQIATAAGRVSTKKTRARVVTFGPSDEKGALLSRTYLSRKVLPGKLALANKGLLLVEDAGQLDQKDAAMIQQALELRSVPMAESLTSHPVRLSVIAVLQKGASLPADLSMALPFILRPKDLIDGRSLALAAFKALGVAPTTDSKPRDLVETQIVKEHVLDLIARVAEEGTPQDPMSCVSLLRCARTLAHQRGRTILGEAEIGSALGLLRTKDMNNLDEKGRIAL